jgi:hypothetical protein
MKTVNTLVRDFEREAEHTFQNFGGKKSEFLGSNQHFNASGMVSEGDVPNEIVITIENTDSLDLAAPIFSANEGIVTPFNSVLDTITGNTATAAKGIVITPQDYTHNELKKMTENSPFTITKLRYDFGDNVQLKKKFVMRKKDGVSYVTTPYYPQNKLNLANNISTVLEDHDFFMVVNAQTTLFVVVGAGKTVQLALTTGARFDATNALKAQTVVTTGRKSY